MTWAADKLLVAVAVAVAYWAVGCLDVVLMELNPLFQNFY